MHQGMRYPVPAVAAIILRDEQILLVQRGVEPAKGKWSVPGGSVEIGETLSEALRREVMEETGLDVEVGALAGTSDLIVRRDGRIEWHYVLINFLATIKSGNMTAASDACECRWVKLSDIQDYDVTKSLIERLEQMGLIEPF